MSEASELLPAKAPQSKTQSRSYTLLISAALAFFSVLAILEAILPAEAIECFVYKHVDDLAAVGVDSTFSRAVTCAPGVNSCLQWKGYYPLESHPVHGFKKVFYDGGCGPKETDMWYYSNVFSCKGNAYQRAEECVADVVVDGWWNGTNGTMNGTDMFNATENGTVAEVVQEVLPMTTEELCANVTRAVLEHERNKGILEVFMHVFLDENPAIANYMWLVFGDAFAAEMSNDLYSELEWEHNAFAAEMSNDSYSTTTTTRDPNLAAELDELAKPMFFFFNNDEEKEPSKFDKPITVLWEEEYSEEVIGARKLLIKIREQMTAVAEIESIHNPLYSLYADSESIKWKGSASSDYHNSMDALEDLMSLMKRAGYRKLIQNLKLWGNGTNDWGMVPYNQTKLLGPFYDSSSASRPNSMEVIAAVDGTQKVDEGHALKTDWWIDGDESLPTPYNVTNHTFLQRLAPLSGPLVERSEEYFAANYSTYQSSPQYKNAEYFANPIFINDQMKFLKILTDVLNETDILGNLDAGSFVGADIPKTKLQKRAQELKVHFQNFDEFLVGEYCFEWNVEQTLLAQNSMGAAYQEMMNPDVRFGILQTMFENDTYTYNYPDEPPCGGGQILEVYAEEKESTGYWDQWQVGKWKGLLVAEDGQLKNTKVKKKDQVLALSGYKSRIHRFNITRHFWPRSGN